MIQQFVPATEVACYKVCSKAALHAVIEPSIETRAFRAPLIYRSATNQSSWKIYSREISALHVSSRKTVRH